MQVSDSQIPVTFPKYLRGAGQDLPNEPNIERIISFSEMDRLELGRICQVENSIEEKI